MSSSSLVEALKTGILNVVQSVCRFGSFAKGANFTGVATFVCKAPFADITVIVLEMWRVDGMSWDLYCLVITAVYVLWPGADMTQADIEVCYEIAPASFDSDPCSASDLPSNMA